jgi:NitT/TauT family transport system substrate-binding protein
MRNGRSVLTRRQLMAVIAAGAAICALPSVASQPLRVGSLRFGSVNWLLHTIEAQHLDAQAGLEMERVDFASNQASTIALLGDSVDMIVSDWLWALRQRAEGEKLLFYPYSSALGAILAPPDSEIGGLSDLAGKRIGVAGSALDKSWLLLRAHLRHDYDFDPAEDARPFYGAPPLLSEQLRMGRLDALLTYWNFAARLEAEGYRVIAEVADVLHALDLDPAPPLVGFVWRDQEERSDQIAAFFRAVEEAQHLLLHDDDVWEGLRPLMRIERPGDFEALRARYRAGVPDPWDAAHQQAARKLFDLLGHLGGEQLIGPMTTFDSKLFVPSKGRQ